MKATTIRGIYNDIKMVRVFTTQIYELPIYVFQVKTLAEDPTLIKYYIYRNDIPKDGEKDIKTDTFERHKVNVGRIDLINYNGKTYISDTLIERAACIDSNMSIGGVNIKDLNIDIDNAICAYESNHAEAVRDFSEYRVECKKSMLRNVDQLMFIVHKSYPFLDKSYIEDIINLIMDHAIINFDLPYNKLEFENKLKLEAVDEAFDFLEEVIRDYKKDFHKQNRMSDIEEMKRDEDRKYKEHMELLSSEWEPDMEGE